MPRRPNTAPVKPHSRAKAAARDRAAEDPDVAWAANIRDRMRADCHPYQLGVVLDEALRIAELVGRGGGKTTSLRVRGVDKIASRRRARVAYVATSRPEAERLNWEPTKELLTQLGEMDNFEFAEQKMRLTCKRTGGTYQFFGADDKREINKLRGQPFDEFQVDEAASHDPVLLETMLDRAVGPRLGERGGAIILAGTPGHVLRGLFYDVTRPGGEMHRPYAMRGDDAYAGWIGWSSHAWDMEQVLALPDAARRYPALALNWAAALLEKQRKAWSDDNPIWLREYRGRWAADNTTTMYAYRAHAADGTPLNQWDPLGWSPAAWKDYEALPFEEQAAACVEMARAAVAALPPDFEDYLFGYGQDLGSKDPYALSVRAFSPSDPLRRSWQVASFGRRKMYARLIAELLIGKEAADLAASGRPFTAGGLFAVTSWPVALVADLAGLGETLIDECANVYGIPMKAAEKAGKFGAIEVVNGDFHDGRAFILANSPLEEQYATLQWKPDEYGQPKEDRSARNDHADADTYVRTAIGAMFGAPPPTSEGEESERRDKPGKPAKGPKRPAPSAPDPGSSEERQARPRGEFDSLMASDDWSGIE